MPKHQPVVLRKGTSVSQNLPRSRAATSTYSDADSKWTAPLPDDASTVQGDRFRVQTGGIASEVDTMSRMNLDGTTTRGGTAATRGAGGRTGGTARASTAASYARTKSGDLKTGIIVWVDEGGGPDPATKLKVVKVHSLSRIEHSRTPKPESIYAPWVRRLSFTCVYGDGEGGLGKKGQKKLSSPKS
jgi:hypothetical protein